MSQMAYEETELKQADQLDKVVENIIHGDSDLFDGVQARRLSHDMLAVIDLATFAMPLEVAEGKEFEERMRLLVARNARRPAPGHDPGSAKVARAWSRFMSPILKVGPAVTAFCVALLVEPVPAGRGGRSIDTLSRPWYNVTTGEQLICSADNEAARLFYFGFSDAGSVCRAVACR